MLKEATAERRGVDEKGRGEERRGEAVPSIIRKDEINVSSHYLFLFKFSHFSTFLHGVEISAAGRCDTRAHFNDLVTFYLNDLVTSYLNDLVTFYLSVR